jgi:HTH-type transcriptional regulator, competence development regulator
MVVDSAFGVHIRALREAKRRVDRDFTLRRFAAALGISATYLSRVEVGQTPPPRAARIKRIAELLDTDPDELLRLALKPDPELVDLLIASPALVQFVRTAKACRATPGELAGFARELRGRTPPR